MSGSGQLRVGHVGGLTAIERKWLERNRACGKEIRVSQNIPKPKARRVSARFTEPKDLKEWRSADAGACMTHCFAAGDD